MADVVVFFPLIFISRTVWAHSDSIPNVVLVLFYIMYSFAGCVYSILLHGIFGQTLGKMLFKVKVIDASENAPITMAQAVRRDAIPVVLTAFGLLTQVPAICRGGTPYDTNAYSLGVFDWVMISTGTLWFWAEIITMLTNKRRRAVHDLIARSVVIRIRQQGGGRTANPDGFTASHHRC